MKKLTKKDVIRINNAYDKFYNELKELSIEELTELGKKSGGSKKKACIVLILEKTMEKRNNKVDNE